MENAPPHRHSTPSEPQTPNSSTISTPCKRPVILPARRPRRGRIQARDFSYHDDPFEDPHSRSSGGVIITNASKPTGYTDTARTSASLRSLESPKTPPSPKAAVILRSPPSLRTPGLIRISRILKIPVTSRSAGALRASLGFRAPITLKSRPTLKTPGTSKCPGTLNTSGVRSAPAVLEPLESLSSPIPSMNPCNPSPPGGIRVPETLNSPRNLGLPSPLASPASFVEDVSSHHSSCPYQVATSKHAHVGQAVVPCACSDPTITPTYSEVHKILWATPSPRPITPVSLNPSANKTQSESEYHLQSPPIHWPTPSPPPSRRPPPPGTSQTRALYAPAVLLYETLISQRLKPNLEILMQHALLEALADDTNGYQPLPTGISLDLHIDALGTYLMQLGLWRFDNAKLAAPPEPHHQWYRYALGECLWAKDMADGLPCLDELMAYADVTVFGRREDDAFWDRQRERTLLEHWLVENGVCEDAQGLLLGRTCWET